MKFNGFPNQLWGWGGEDDITYDRCTILGKIKEMQVPNKGSYSEFYHKESSNTSVSDMGSVIKKKLILDDLDSDNKDGLSHLKLSDNLKIDKINDFTIKCTFTLTTKQ